MNSLLKILPISLIGIFYLDSLIWLVQQYLSSPTNLIAGLVLLIGLINLIYLYATKQIIFDLTLSKYRLLALVLMALAELINRAWFHLDLATAILLVSSWLIAAWPATPKHQFRIFNYIPLLYLGLPMIYQLNISLGIILRQIYLQILLMLLRITNIPFQQVDTAVIFDNRYINIDYGCSGVVGLWTVSVIYFLIRASSARNYLVFYPISIFSYIFLTILQILLLSLLLPVNQDLSLTQAHQIISTINLILALIAGFSGEYLQQTWQLRHSK